MYLDLELLIQYVNQDNMNIDHRFDYGYTPLIYAAQTSDLPMTEYIVSNLHPNPNLYDYDNRTPLHHAVMNIHEPIQSPSFHSRYPGESL